MNLLLFRDEDFTGPDTVSITGRRFMHVKKVIRAKIGTQLACGRLNGMMGTGEVTAIDRNGFQMTVSFDRQPPPKLPLTLVLAMPRPKMLKRILQAATSMGVRDIYLINAFRVEKSFWLSDLLEPEKLERHLLLGLEQAKDTVLPNLYLKRYFTSFVKTDLTRMSQGKNCILAHPKTSQPCPVGVKEDTILVIGPEGGFIDLEVETLGEAGFAPYSMGQRILRVETAVTALISRLFPA
ncbi:MAG TPA: 16S rRNA (uracil(1498)-N(3))-methyltransferase [Desulfobacteraceae bacterium]|nr:16S rRNA (uracil(1498)-N(3))-methyltransferase [Desulfobacteraceae bacterium]|tara:strand:- start:44 stop:757 length:714 start_codon:yes stop_codon:yes gene_type:complete